MNNDLALTLQQYSNRNLEHRKQWYSPAARAYAEARPHYPDEIVRRVIDIAQLSSQSTILEIGCGPATATVSFAPLGCVFHGLEPNPDFYKIAVQNTRSFENVTLHNTAFEEWELQANSFDAVLAASSFHWIPADVGYPKAAQALKQDGRLILLWNKELQPPYEVHEYLSDIYDDYAPHLNRYEHREAQVAILDGLGKLVGDSGYFKNLVSGHVEVEVTYSIAQYLTLLNTYSPYLMLEPHIKELLFHELQIRLNDKCGETVRLFGISAFHIAQRG